MPLIAEPAGNVSCHQMCTVVIRLFCLDKVFIYLVPPAVAESDYSTYLQHILLLASWQNPSLCISEAYLSFWFAFTILSEMGIMHVSLHVMYSFRNELIRAISTILNFCSFKCIGSFAAWHPGVWLTMENDRKRARYWQRRLHNWTLLSTMCHLSYALMMVQTEQLSHPMKSKLHFKIWSGQVFFFSSLLYSK